MDQTRRLLDYYLPPGEGFVLESLIATTYQVDFEFLEEELLAAALGVRSPLSRMKAFRSELERALQKTLLSVLYDKAGCEKLARLSPRIDPIRVSARKLHSKISLLMWIRDNKAAGAPPERRVRLIVGSANLTRQGFRHNYECIVPVDFGGRSTSSRELLTKAIDLIRQIGAESRSGQLKDQLEMFRVQAARLPEGVHSNDDPVALVTGDEVVPILRQTWGSFSNKPPESATIVSPFWFEGATASDGLLQLFEKLGSPKKLELVCRGEASGDGKNWLPVFDRAIAVGLKKQLASQLFLRPTLPNSGITDSKPATEDIGDDLEDREFAATIGAEKLNALQIQRGLHAKMIFLDGPSGSVLYAGSSNCTRKGLGLPGVQANYEAGFIYRLTTRQRKQINSLLAFAGQASEVRSEVAPETIQPTPGEEFAVPTFISEVVAAGNIITIFFCEPVPSDAVLLMPIPKKAGTSGFWLLFVAGNHESELDRPFIVDLATCQKCDEKLVSLLSEPNDRPVVSNIFIQARWEGKTADLPVRFEDKARLPLLLVGRKPTEGELIDYFLIGKQPRELDDGGGLTEKDGEESGHPDAPIDTRRILTYFMRRFVQAIPGIETEVTRAAYSRASLESALLGPTSPLELAERAFASLTAPPRKDEPAKTPTSVAFQLSEILAALLRCRKIITAPELQPCFTPALSRCREMLDLLVSHYPELRAGIFQIYQKAILEDAQ